MNCLLEAFSKKFVLLVSITRNQLELAEIAQAAGADAVKVHLNCAHFASGTNFGSWPEEKAAVTEIRQKLHIPVGIVTGAETVPPREQLADIRQAGFDFWDLFAHHIPPEYLDWKEMAHMSAVGPDWTGDFVRELTALGIDVIESSIIPRTEYRTRLTAADLCRYSALVKAAKVPVIVPTQKAIQPHEIKYLHAVGVKGLAIGAVVTGLGSQNLAKTIASYRQAIDELT